MTIIKESVETVRKCWGEQKVQPTRYRLIKYLLREDVDEGVLLCNTVSGELVLLNDEEKLLLDTLPSEYSDVMSDLVKHHFLVPVDYDEHATVYSLRKIFRTFFEKKDITGYTILPTTCCNARCFYCYEANIEHVTMTEETADKVVDFISSHCGEKKTVSLSWFGGEPTLGWKRIDQICNALTEKGISYSSSMISNGFLFDDSMADKARDLWKLKMIQITLDGTEEVYNKVKSYVGITESAYKRVLRNIGLLVDRGIRVSVRMNLDRHNADNLSELINELTERFKGNEHFSAYVWPLFDNCGFDPVKHSASDNQWLVNKQIELNNSMKADGMYSEREKSLPSLKFSSCMADNVSSIIINSNGELSKCEHTFATDIVGKLDTGIINTKRCSEWKETTEYDNCSECKLFPHCYILKNCFSTNICYSEIQKTKLQNFEELLLKEFNKYKNNSKSEVIV